MSTCVPRYNHCFRYALSNQKAKILYDKKIARRCVAHTRRPLRAQTQMQIGKATTTVTGVAQRGSNHRRQQIAAFGLEKTTNRALQRCFGSSSTTSAPHRKCKMPRRHPSLPPNAPIPPANPRTLPASSSASLGAFFRTFGVGLGPTWLLLERSIGNLSKHTLTALSRWLVHCQTLRLLQKRPASHSSRSTSLQRQSGTKHWSTGNGCQPEHPGHRNRARVD